MMMVPMALEVRGVPRERGQRSHVAGGGSALNLKRAVRQVGNRGNLRPRRPVGREPDQGFLALAEDGNVGAQLA